MALIVVRIHQGASFPSSGDVVIKGRWASEDAQTEAVASTHSLLIHQEFAFKVRKKKQLKKNKKILLECLHLVPDSEQSVIGTVELILPPIASPTQKNWIQVRTPSSDICDNPPALLVSVFYENMAALGDCTGSNESCSHSLASASDNKDLLRPILVNDDYYRIGNAPNTDFYSLAITLSFAENLMSLLPAKSLWPPEQASFHFHMTVMGNVISFQPFCKLRDPVRISERATVKIQSQSHQLLSFFKRFLPTLSVCLSCDGIPIGETTVPFGDYLIKANLDRHFIERLDMEPIKIAGLYPMKSLLKESETGNEGFGPSKIGLQVLISQLPKEGKEEPPKPVDIVAESPSTSTQRNSSLLSGPSLKNAKLDKNDLVYAAALELELWKEDQKQLAYSKLKEQTCSQLELLNTEYRRQVSLREAAIQRRFEACRQLEQQLEKTIAEVRQKEQQLLRDQDQLNKQRNQLQAERKEVSSEVERVTQRLQNEYEFKLRAERKRHGFIVNELRQRLKQLPSQIDQSKDDAETQLEGTRLTNSIREGEEKQARMMEQIDRLRESQLLWQKTVAEQHLVLCKLRPHLSAFVKHAPPNGRHEKNLLLQESQAIIDKVEPMLKALQ